MKNIVNKDIMTLVISRFMNTVLAHTRETGHNAADREMNEAIYLASMADTEANQRLAISRLAQDVVPFVSEKGKSIVAVNSVINELINLDNKIKGIVPPTSTLEIKDMNIIIANFLKFGCSNIRCRGQGTAGREIDEALQLASNAKTPPEQAKAIKALVRDVLPYIPSEEQNMSKSYQAISDLQHMGIMINKRTPTKDNDGLSI